MPSQRTSLSRFLTWIIGLAAAANAAAQYSITVLHPTTGGFQWTLGYAVDGDTQGGWGYTTGLLLRAVIWHGSAGSMVDITPDAYGNSQIFALNGNSQVGSGRVNATNEERALLWTGTAASVVDLNPAGYTSSQANGVWGNIQVGSAEDSLDRQFHALMWRGSAASVVDLQPPGMVRSEAAAVYGNSQVGAASPTTTGDTYHAFLWSGTAASAIDLHPASFTETFAKAVCGDMQGGSGFGPTTGNDYHALLWHGTAASMIDMNPSGMRVSQILSMSQDSQVGHGYGPATGGDFISHALLWHGSPQSAIDLHSYVTGLFWNGNPLTLNRSVAVGIDSNGNICGYGEDASNNYYALLWKPIRTVAGTVNLQNFSASPSGVQATVEIRNPGSSTALDSHNVTLDSSGGFSFTTSLPPGTYDIAVKASHWLRQTLPSRTVGTFGASGLNYSLINGDINRDNAVTLGDFAALRAAFGSSSGDPNWNPNTDLNGDGAITLGDFATLRANFGRQGDP